MDTPTDLPTALTFRISDDGHALLAVIAGGMSDTSINLVALNKLLSENGHVAWQFDEAALAKVCDLVGHSANGCEITIGNRVDAAVTVELPESAEFALVTVTPPLGGNPVTRAQIMAALKEKGVIHGIDHAAIDGIVATGVADNAAVAKATPPQHGSDCMFESLIPNVVDRRPKVNERGRVDYHETGAFITVRSGDPLMRRTPPGPGQNGTDVLGKVIPARPGRPLEFAANLTGAAIDGANPNLLRAISGGQPEIVEFGMNINPVIEAQEAGLATGNIYFEGTVTIRGDVRSGMKIHATRDIVVGGTVEGAELQAGGNIQVHGGVIGHGEVRNTRHEQGFGSARLTAMGIVEARFFENAIISAGDSVIAAELISNCQTAAVNQVIVGGKGTKKGHILGGKTSASLAVQAYVIGSPSNVRTQIEVGMKPELRQQLKQQEAELREKLEEQEKLCTLARRIRHQTDDKSRALLAKVANTLQQVNSDIAALNARKAQLDAEKNALDDASVTVGLHAYGGVTIHIGNSHRTLQDRCEAGRFLLENGTVAFVLA